MPTTISISNQRLRERAKVIAPTVSTTLSEADSFQEINIGTDALVMTLPLITSSNLGLTYTFRNIAANGAAMIQAGESNLELDKILHCSLLNRNTLVCL